MQCKDCKSWEEISEDILLKKDIGYCRLLPRSFNEPIITQKTQGCTLCDILDNIPTMGQLKPLKTKTKKG